jgi:hypothetical protein
MSGASLPIFQWGDCTQTWSIDAPVDHVTMAWLAKDCNGIKQYTKSTLPSCKLLVKLLYV